MTTPTTPSTADPAFSDNEAVNVTNPDAPPPPRSKRCRLLGLLVLVLLVLAIVGAGVAYYRLAKLNLKLANQMDSLNTEVTHAQQDILNLNHAIEGANAIAQKSAQLSQQQESVLAEWQAAQKGDLSRWKVAEAQYLIRIANNQLRFYNNSNLAITLLQQANNLIADVNDTSNLREATTATIAKLQATPQVDTTELYLRLAALEKTLDELPLQSYPLKTQTMSNPPNPTTTTTEQLAWWRVGLNKAFDALASLVVVKNTSDTPLPLIIPEEKLFLLQNLHAQFGSARWAALNQNNVIYQDSLQNILDWVARYYKVDNDITKNLLDKIIELKKLNVNPNQNVDLSSNLQRFDEFMANHPATTSSRSTSP